MYRELGGYEAQQTSIQRSKQRDAKTYVGGMVHDRAQTLRFVFIHYAWIT